ncbi:MAG: hypothetical protein ABSH41_07510 [Syntrophobacteraceae bacterium]
MTRTTRIHHTCFLLGKTGAKHGSWSSGNLLSTGIAALPDKLKDAVKGILSEAISTHPAFYIRPWCHVLYQGKRLRQGLKKGVNIIEGTS